MDGPSLRDGFLVAWKAELWLGNPVHPMSPDGLSSHREGAPHGHRCGYCGCLNCRAGKGIHVFPIPAWGSFPGGENLRSISVVSRAGGASQCVS